MKNISTNLAVRLAGEDILLASCLRVTLTSGAVLGFTSLDEDLEIGGVTYVSAAGADAGDIANASTLEVDNLELHGAMVSPAITEEDLRAGVWDFAKMMLFLVDAEHPTDGVVIQRVGWIGVVTLAAGRFKAEFRGLTQAYKTSIGELTSATCRAKLGDARCKVVLSGSPSGSPSFVAPGNVDSIDSDYVTIHDASRNEPPHPSGTAYYIGGVLTFTSGNNNGLSMEIREATTGVLQLGMPMPYMVQAGDSYVITPGCPKHKQDCIGTFNNIINFRGEPDLGGNDLLVQIGRDT